MVQGFVVQQHRGALGLLDHGFQRRGIYGDVRDLLVFQQDAVALLRGSSHGLHRQADGLTPRLGAVDGHQVVLDAAHGVGKARGSNPVVVLIGVLVASAGGFGGCGGCCFGGSGGHFVSACRFCFRHAERQLLVVNECGNLCTVMRYSSTRKGRVNGN